MCCFFGGREGSQRMRRQALHTDGSPTDKDVGTRLAALR